MAPVWSQQTASTEDARAKAKSYTQFGFSNGSRGDYNGAINAFNQALKFDSSYVPAYYGRGYARGAQKDYDGALADFNHALQIDPTYLAAYYQRGCLKGQEGDFDAAVTDFKQVLKLDPKYAAAYYNLGHVYYFKGDLDGAIEQITQGLSLQPDFALGYWIRGLARHALGQRMEAQADFQKSAGLNFSYATFSLWMTQVEDGERGMAWQNLSDELAKPELFKPDDWATQIAKFLLDKISQDQLLAAANQGDPSGTQDRLCEAWYYIGMVKHFAGDDKGARECYAKAVATDVKSSEEYLEAGRQAAN